MIDITIIVPVYNVEKYLHKCLYSILNQSIKNIEVICVDDGSTDSSSSICDYYKEQDSRVHVIHKKNGGLVTARKEGLKYANGKYVGFVDGDDWIDKDMYQEMYNAIEKYNVSMVETGVIDCDEENETERNYKLKCGVYIGEDYGRYILNNLIYDGNFYEFGTVTPYIWNKLFVRDYICDIYGKLNDKQSMLEDFVSVIPYLMKWHSIYIFNKAFYHYRVVRNSIKRKKVNEFEELLNMHIKLLYKNLDYTGIYKESILQQINYFKMYFCIMLNIKMFDKNEKLLIPFGGVDKNEKIILYGAGVVGINIYRYIDKINSSMVINWVDKSWENFKGSEYQVNNPLSINKNGEEKIIISVLRARDVTQIKRRLINSGIRTERILWIKEEYINDPKKLFC